MPARIDSIRVTVTTGERPLDEPVRIRFNGFELKLNRISGGTDAGESFVGEFFLGSVAHSCDLMGPETGTWDIKELQVHYDDEGGEVMCHHFHAVTLTPGESLDILTPPPPPSFEV